MSAKGWIVIGALLAGLSVALGAFGAHAVPGYLKSAGLSEADLARRLANWETAARYHMYHALATIVVGWLVSRGAGGAAQAAGWTFLAGMALFCGCLYAYVLGGPKPLVHIVPLGGTLLIIGWALVAWSAWKS